ncbi:MAG: phosphoglycolate phosphatase [Marivibrio sp.]|uniref:phosphoglycolate phosphatase n=1 Tax=Marivibrio sp. TaxID=2039719 RepID=UPI0032ED93B1
MTPPLSSLADRLIVFDLDGTLIDSAPDLAAALNRLLAAEGRAMLPFRQVRAMIGRGAQKLVARGFAATGGPPADLEAATARFLAIYGRALACHTRPYPGVPETLERLRGAGARFALLTNKPQAPSEAILAELGLNGWFEAGLVLGGDAAPAKKPDPAGLIALMTAAGVPAARTILVGDSAADVDAARAAGVACVAVAYGYTQEPAAELGADLVLAGFSDLPAALDAMIARG